MANNQHERSGASIALQRPNAPAVIKPLLTDTDKLEALERVIVRNYFDIGRPDMAAEERTGEIMQTAQMWLVHLRRVPNSNVLHEGGEMHLIERVYLYSMEHYPSGFPLTVAELVKAWNELEASWQGDRGHTVRADTPEGRRDQRQLEEFELAPLVPRPISRAEEKRRQELCARSRQELGLPAYGETEKPRDPRPKAPPGAGEVESVGKVAKRVKKDMENRLDK